jgi:sulfur carrier protein
VLSLTVNGEPREVDDGTTVARLLGELGLAPPGIAVAVNQRVVRAANLSGHALREGDTVEIIRAAAGG